MHSAIGALLRPQSITILGASAAVPAKHVPETRHVLGERKTAGHPRA